MPSPPSLTWSGAGHPSVGPLDLAFPPFPLASRRSYRTSPRHCWRRASYRSRECRNRHRRQRVLSQHHPDGRGGFESTHSGTWIQGPSSLWSLGAQATELLFDAGKRHAVTDQARHNYEAQASTYKATVLGAFNEVEDKLSDLRVLEQETAVGAPGSRCGSALARPLQSALQGRRYQLPRSADR